MNGGSTVHTIPLKPQSVGQWAQLQSNTFYMGGNIPTDLPLTTKTVFTIWRTTLRHIKWEGKFTEETPLWEGSVLPQVARLVGFRKWDLIGISRVGQVTCNNSIESFAELQK